VPGRAYGVRVRGTARRLDANARGRLRIVVPLGPGNRGQQYAAGVHTRVFTSRVTIR